MAAAVLAAATVLTYNMGYMPTGVNYQGSSITAEAFDTDGKLYYSKDGVKTFGENKLGSISNPDTNTNNFFGYLNRYYTYEKDSANSSATVYAIKIKKGRKNNPDFKTAQFPAPYTQDGVTYKITSIANGAFENYTNITHVLLPCSIKDIGAYAFSGCTSLQTVSFTNRATSLESDTSVVQTSDLRSINKEAFKGCSKLRLFDMNPVAAFENLTIIDEGAFKDTALKVGYIPKNLSMIKATADGTGENYNPYEDIPTLNKYIVAPNQTKGYYAIDGVLCKTTDSGKALAAYPAAKTGDSYTIPEEIDAIGNYAFKKVKNENLSVTIPSTVTTVGSCAFYEGTLKNITINGAPTIYDEFMCETNIGTLTINGEARWNKESGSAYWFHHCNINKVIFTKNFTWRLPDEPISMNFELFGVSTRSAEGYYLYHDEYNYAYMKANFYNSVDTVEIQGKWNLRGGSDGKGELYGFGEHMFQGVKHVKFTDPDCEITKYMFYMCPELETVELPENLKEIPTCAFAYTYSLQSLDIPNTVTTIGACAFENTGLKSLVIPDSVTSLGNSSEGWYTFRTSNEKWLRDDEFTPQLVDLYIPSTLTYYLLKDMEYGTFRTWEGINVTEGTYPVTLHGVAGSGAEEYASKHANVTFAGMDDLSAYSVTKIDGDAPATYEHDGITYYVSDSVKPNFTLTNGTKTYTNASAELNCSFSGSSEDIRYYDVTFADETQGYGKMRIFFAYPKSQFKCLEDNDVTHSYDKVNVKTLAPTCTEGGYDYYECIYCGEKKSIGNETAALGHDWGE